MSCITTLTLKLPCLGRPFRLGMLYDCRSDCIVPGKTLWDDKLLNDALSERPQPSSCFEIIAEDTTTDKMFNLGVEGNLSLSILGGLVSVNGSAKYVEDHKSSSNHARVTLKYTSTSKFQQLTMKQLATSNIQYPEVFDEGIATHVVTGVLFGADAFFIFDREVGQEENYHKVHGDMEVSIKAIPNLQVGGGVGVDIETKNKQETEKFHCKFYGDLRLDNNPSTFQEAVAIYKKLPEYFCNNTVPKEVWLYPLSNFDTKAAKMVREIRNDLVTQAQQITEVFRNMLMKSNDLMKNDVCECFPVIKDQLLQFKEMIGEYKINFVKQLSSILPKIRGGELAEQELEDLIVTIRKSPFNKCSLNSWLDRKAGEIRVLSNYFVVIRKTKGVEITKTPSDFPSAINDVTYDYVLSFEFKVVKKKDSFLESMFSYLRKHDVSVDHSTQDDSSKQWFTSPEIIEDLRLKCKQFTTFAEANYEKKSAKFIVRNNSEVGSEGTDDGIPINKGADIILYQNGSPSVFEPPSQPEKLSAINVTHESIRLTWSPPQYGVTSIKCYTVLYRPTDASEEWGWKTQRTKQKETSMTIMQLASEKNYSFKVCAECEYGLSRESEHIEIKTHRSVKVLLIGKAGSGKSTLGNLLIKEKKFKESCEVSVVTGDAEIGICPVDINKDQFTLHIIDTPGFADATQIDRDVLAKIAKGIRLLIQDGGPAAIHTIIFVLSGSKRFTKSDEIIMEYFAKEGSNFWSHAMLVITNASRYGKTKCDQHRLLKKQKRDPNCPRVLKTLFEKIENRIVFVESESTNGEEIQAARLEILTVIQEMSSQEDGGYVHDVITKAKESWDVNGGNIKEANEAIIKEISQEVNIQTKDDNSECFPGDSTVITKDGIKLMHEINPGDEVLAVTPGGSTIFSEVVTFLHYEPKTFATYITIQTMSETLLHVSSNHLVFSVTPDVASIKFKSKAVMASCIKCGDYILEIKSPSSQIQSTQVTSIDTVCKQGVYAPMTQCGTIVVDSSVASCYATYPSHTLAHVVMAPLRIYYNITKHHRRGVPLTEGVNSYAAFLYKLVY